MKISKIKTVYFSPCGATKSVAEFIGKTLAEQLKVPNENISYTLPVERNRLMDKLKKTLDSSELMINSPTNSQNGIFSSNQFLRKSVLSKEDDLFEELNRKIQANQMNREKATFKNDELVIWASPVYAGRIPNKTLDFVKDVLRGNGTPAIPVVVFGNRNFDNALAELTGIMKDNGLRPIAGAAVVARHAFDTADSSAGAPESEIRTAAGASDINIRKAGERQLSGELSSDCDITETGDRPSESDFEEIKEFCVYVANCIKTNHELKFVITAPGDEHPAKYYTPLKEDGTPANFLKAKPRLNSELCVSCGICSEVCPMGSIEFEHEDMFDFSNNEGTCDKKTGGSTEKNCDETNCLQNGQIITNGKGNQTQFGMDFNSHMDGADCQINNNDEIEVERHPKFTGICIKCQACIRNCPSDALYFDDEEFLSHVRMIKRDYSEPQENCFIC